MLPAQVQEILAANGSGSRFQAALDAIADTFGAATATLHRADTGSRTLHLLASRGMPEHLLPITRTIPFGKGMAGLCAERRDLVTVCNLQTDASGVARPAAKETGVAGAIVVPIFAPGTGAGTANQGRDTGETGTGTGEIVGTLGVGKAGEHEYTEEERETLRRCAAALAPALAPQ